MSSLFVVARSGSLELRFDDPHSRSFSITRFAVFLATLFLYLLDLPGERMSRWFLCGLAGGLLTQTRYQGLLLAHLPAET